MPTKPLHPCSYPGCPKLTASRYCEEHQKLTSRQYERYGRDPASKKRYGRTWRKARERFLAAHPLCEECRKRGQTTPATEVHHILPLGRGGANHESNLMPLCKPCHSAISARDGDRWGQG
jgi:5-methylcytosine-specific restriction protein A